MSHVRDASIFFVVALMLGLGLGIGSMTDSRRAPAFFDVRGISRGTWDPTLGVVFFCALTTYAMMLHYAVIPNSKPLNKPSFSFPTRQDVTSELVAGSALFGTGWAVIGACPGPAIVSVASMSSPALLAVLGMLCGLGVHRLVKGRVLSIEVFAGLFVSVLALLLISENPGDTRETQDGALPVDIVLAAIGGVLIGSAGALLALLEGRVMGISGIIGGVVDDGEPEVVNRIAFLLGLLVAGVALQRLAPQVLLGPVGLQPMLVIVGGALVGYGTAMGSGCTSGHGICGLSRRSRRSMVAVATFMGVNALLSSVM